MGWRFCRECFYKVCIPSSLHMSEREILLEFCLCGFILVAKDQKRKRIYRDLQKQFVHPMPKSYISVWHIVIIHISLPCFEIFCKSQFTLNSLSFRLKRCHYEPHQVFVCGTLDQKRLSQTSMQGGTYKMHFILYRGDKFCFFAVLTSQCFTLFFYCLDRRLCYRRDNETKNTETSTIVLSEISMKFRAFSSRA